MTPVAMATPQAPGTTWVMNSVASAELRIFSTL
jgi:hypothetical protein